MSHSIHQTSSDQPTRGTAEDSISEEIVQGFRGTVWNEGCSCFSRKPPNASPAQVGRMFKELLYLEFGPLWVEQVI